MPSPSQQAGTVVENRALAELDAAGLQLIERNYRVRAGEIDLIMRHGDTVVFVEVRARSSNAFGGAAASITGLKQRRIQRAAQLWLLRRYGASGWPACRFDAVVQEHDGRLQWLQSAF